MRGCERLMLGVYMLRDINELIPVPFLNTLPVPGHAIRN